MIKTEEFQRVCRLAGLVEVSNSKTCAFKTFDQKEGIEVIAGKIQTFQIIEMKDKTKEKVISDKVQNKDVLAVVGAFEFDTKEPVNMNNIAVISDKEHSYNDAKIIESIANTPVPNSINCIPAILEDKRIITPQDIEGWKKLSVFDRILLFQKTSKNIIKTRRGFLLPEFAGRDKKNLTDEHYKMFSYIPANVMKLSANIAFLFEWSAVVESEKYFENEVCVRGYFQVEINGKMYRRPCGGSCVKKGMMDWGDTMQGAISEMEKRGIYDFLHGDVRRGDVDES